MIGYVCRIVNTDIPYYPAVFLFELLVYTNCHTALFLSGIRETLMKAFPPRKSQARSAFLPRKSQWKGTKHLSTAIFWDPAGGY